METVAAKIRFRTMLLNIVRAMLFIQRLTLETELGLYCDMSSRARKNKSPPQNKKNLVNDASVTRIPLPRENLRTSHKLVYWSNGFI
jgi:hypothetical protein